MNPIAIDAAGGVILFNSLHRRPEVSQLMQDLLAVELPDGRFIDVGWYPQFDPSGQYRVALLDSEGKRLWTAIETSDIDQVVSTVEALIRNGDLRSETADCPSRANASAS